MFPPTKKFIQYSILIFLIAIALLAAALVANQRAYGAGRHMLDADCFVARAMKLPTGMMSIGCDDDHNGKIDRVLLIDWDVAGKHVIRDFPGCHEYNQWVGIFGKEYRINAAGCD